MFRLGEAVSHISAKLRPNINQLQQATILQWVAARWRFAVKDDGNRGNPPATVAAAKANRPRTRTGRPQLWKPTIRAGPQSTMKTHEKRGAKSGRNEFKKKTVFNRRREKIKFSAKKTKDEAF